MTPEPPTDPPDFATRLRDALPRATRLAIRLTGDPAAAEDLVGEAMLRAVRSQHRFRGEAGFDTWLYRVVVNAFRDSLRRKASRDKLRPPPPEVVSDAAAPLRQRERARQIAACVSNLPPRQREAVVLTFYEGMTAADAAEILGTTAGNVRVLLHHAREKLRESLAEFAPENDHV